MVRGFLPLSTTDISSGATVSIDVTTSADNEDFSGNNIKLTAFNTDNGLTGAAGYHIIKIDNTAPTQTVTLKKEDGTFIAVNGFECPSTTQLASGTFQLMVTGDDELALTPACTAASANAETITVDN